MKRRQLFIGDLVKISDSRTASYGQTGIVLSDRGPLFEGSVRLLEIFVCSKKVLVTCDHVRKVNA